MRTTRTSSTGPHAEKLPTSCPFCGACYRVDTAHVGKRIQCKNCPKTFIIRALAESQSGAATPFPVKRLVALACVVVVGTCALLLVLQFQATNRDRASTRDALIRLVDQRIAQSNSEAAAFDFAAGNRTLRAADTAVRAASVDVATDESLKGKILAADNVLREAQEDHTAKVRNGWQLVEGRFISPDQQKRFVLEREAEARAREQKRMEAKRQEQERERQAEAMRREEQQRRLEEQQRPWLEAVDLNKTHRQYDETRGLMMGTRNDALSTLWSANSIQKEKAKQLTYKAVFRGQPKVVEEHVTGGFRFTTRAAHFNIWRVDWTGGYTFVHGAIDFTIATTHSYGVLVVIPIKGTVEEAESIQSRLNSGDGLRVLFRVGKVSVDQSPQKSLHYVLLAAPQAIEWLD